MIEVKEAKSAKEMKQFVDLPFEVYKNNPYWVPPIKKDDLASFDSKNDIFKTVDAKFFLAYKNNQLVGRIVSIINWKEVKELNKPKIRFGWLVFKDDIDVLNALLTTVENIGKQNKLSFIEGPMPNLASGQSLRTAWAMRCAVSGPVTGFFSVHSISAGAFIFCMSGARNR